MIPRGSVRKRSNALRVAVVLVAILTTASVGTAAAADPPWVPAPPLSPLDEQVVEDQQDMTWADYAPIPGYNWGASNGATATQRQQSIALVAVDFEDQPFVITQPKFSDPFGNPQIDPVARADVPQFYRDFLHVPSALNHGQTLNGYWM